jgi:hypothetical protein
LDRFPLPTRTFPDAQCEGIREGINYFFAVYPRIERVGFSAALFEIGAGAFDRIFKLLVALVFVAAPETSEPCLGGSNEQSKQSDRPASFNVPELIVYCGAARKLRFERKARTRHAWTSPSHFIR